MLIDIFSKQKNKSLNMGKKYLKDVVKHSKTISKLNKRLNEKLNLEHTGINPFVWDNPYIVCRCKEIKYRISDFHYKERPLGSIDKSKTDKRSDKNKLIENYIDTTE